MSDWGSANQGKMQDVLSLMAQKNAKNKDIFDTFTGSGLQAASMLGDIQKQKSAQDFTAGENQKDRSLQLQLPDIQAKAKVAADQQFSQFLKDQGINVGDNGYKYDFTDSYGRRWTSTNKGEHEMNLRTNDAWWQVYLARQGQNKDQNKDPNAWYLDTVGALQSVNKNDTTGVTDPLHQMDPAGLTKQFQTYLNTSGFDPGVQEELLKRFHDQIGNRGAKDVPSVDQGGTSEVWKKANQLSQSLYNAAGASTGNITDLGAIALDPSQWNNVTYSGNLGPKEKEILKSMKDLLGGGAVKNIKDPQAYLNELTALDYARSQLYRKSGDDPAAIDRMAKILSNIRAMAEPAGGF